MNGPRFGPHLDVIFLNLPNVRAVGPQKAPRPCTFDVKLCPTGPHGAYSLCNLARRAPYKGLGPCITGAVGPGA